ncbi:MAG: c-type cytochrome [Desulfobaccales bacterium]
MKFRVTVCFLVLMGFTASAWAQGGSVEKGKALVESKKCALCHKPDSPTGKPLEMLVGTNADAFLKEAITNPKKACGPQVKMPEFKLTDEQLKDVIAYLRSLAKH